MRRVFFIMATAAVLGIVYISAEAYNLLGQHYLINFLATNFSPDGNISNPQYYYFFLVVFNAYIIVFSLISFKFFLNKTGFPPIKIEPLSALSLLSILLFVILRPHHSATPISFDEFPGIINILYQEDGIFETLTAIFFFVAVIFFVRSIFFIRSSQKPTEKIYNHKGILVLVLLTSICAFIGLEEISYGQRIFNWETPESIRDLNYQAQLNLHNIYTPLFVYIYPIFSALVSLSLVFLIALRSHPSSLGFRGFLPQEKYFLQSILFYISTYSGHEVVEFMLSMSAFSYSWDVWNRIKYTTEVDTFQKNFLAPPYTQ